MRFAEKLPDFKYRFALLQQFKEFEKALRGIRYHSITDWEILMPFNTKPEMLQRVIQKCREFLLIDWHVTFADPTEENPEPEIRMYWDRMNIH